MAEPTDKDRAKVTRRTVTLPSLRALLAVVVTLGVSAVFAWQLVTYLNHRAEDDRRTEVLSLAKAQVIDLTTLDSTTVEGKLKALKDRTSGQFKRQLEGMASTFAGVVSDSKVKADGVVTSAAIDELSEKKASVLIASTSTVSNSKQPQPSTGTYRFRVDLVNSGGTWLISGMEFVQ